MRRNPERLAWIALAASFALFCVLIVSVPLGIRSYLLNSYDVHEATVESLVGTVVIENPGGTGPKPVAKDHSAQVREGGVIIVDETSEAVVTFFDNSFMRLAPGTEISVLEMRSPRYDISADSNRIVLREKGGMISVRTALAASPKLHLEVQSLQATAIFEGDGSYAVEATNDRSEIIVHRGAAVVQAAQQSVVLGSRERSTVEIGQPPTLPLPAERDLITNSAFDESLERGWIIYNDQGLDGGDVNGQVIHTVEGGQRVVRLLRTGGQGNHCETVLEQIINRDLPDPPTLLKVRATVKVSNQGLSGGGYLSSEYPLMIRITYRDVYDSEAEWIHGFYYQNVDNNPTIYGESIARDRWYLFESENLIEALDIVPDRIVSLKVYASGWDYDSMVSEINLVVE